VMSAIATSFAKIFDYELVQQLQETQ
jgi:hypothetical protein